MLDMPKECFFCNGKVDMKRDIERDAIYYDCKVCKRVRISEHVLPEYQDCYQGKRHLISGYIRERTSYGETAPFIRSADDLKYILNSPSIPREVMEKADKLVLWLGHQSEYPGHWIPIDRDSDYPICYCKNGEEFGYIYEFLVGHGLIERPSIKKLLLRLTMDGWERFSNLK